MTEADPSLALDAAIEGIDYPDADAAQAAIVRLQQLAVPSDTLGVLAELASWAAGVQGRCPPRAFEQARLVLFAGDHGIAATGDLGQGGRTTVEQLADVQNGAAVLNILAAAAGVHIRPVDLSVDADTDPAIWGWKVRRSSGRIDREDALSLAEAASAVEAGIAIADREIDAGADLLIAADLGVGNAVAAATLISVLTDTEPIKVVGSAGSLTDEQWIRSCAAIRDARRRAWLHRTEPIELLAAVAGADLAAMTGFLLQAANRRTPVLLDGLVPTAAALTAQLACPRVVRWFQSAHLSSDPGHELALQRLGLNPLLSLRVRHGQGTGALLALPLVQAAARILGESAVVIESAESSQAAVEPEVDGPAATAI